MGPNQAVLYFITCIIKGGLTINSCTCCETCKTDGPIKPWKGQISGYGQNFHFLRAGFPFFMFLSAEFPFSD